MKHDKKVVNARKSMDPKSINFERDPVWLAQYEKFCNCDSEDCRCGETNVHEWAWDDVDSSYTIALSENNLVVKFHNGFSSGTAAIRGSRLLERGRHYYWEIKMLTPIYGTDIMVGVGTCKVDFDSAKELFCSFLGRDHESFGYSYQGYIQHGGQTRNYGPCFGQGSIVGVYLDTWKGTLEFFLNRKSLGVAFTGLKDIMLYPMVSSTSAHSKMRLTHSSSVPATLQIECLAALKSSHKAYLSAMFPGLRHLTRSIFADIFKRRTNNGMSEKDEYVTDDMILDDFDYALVGNIKKKRRRRTNDDYPVSTNGGDVN